MSSDTISDKSPQPTQLPAVSSTQGSFNEALIVKLNRVISSHYPQGVVDYPEAVRVLKSLHMSYMHMLQRLDAGEAMVHVAEQGFIEQLFKTMASMEEAGAKIRASMPVSQVFGQGRHSRLAVPPGIKPSVKRTGRDED